MVVVSWGLVLGAGNTQVPHCPMQSCSSGGQQCLGLCDLSMVVLLYSLPVPLPVLFLLGIKTWLNYTEWYTVSFEKVIKQKKTSRGKNLDNTPHCPFHVN